MNMKPRLGASLLAITFVLSPLVQAASFPDVPENHPYHRAVEYFYSIEAVGGYDDGTFKPDQAVNRAEALKMIFAGSPRVFVVNNEITEDLFPDVPKDAWFTPFIGKALELGIIGGNSDGTFAPARTVNKAELLKMLLLANEVDTTPYKEKTISANDTPKDAWFYEYMAYGTEYGVVFSNGSGQLEPGKALSRGEVLQIMYNYIKNEKGGDLQQLLSRTEARLVSSMDKLGARDYEGALTLSREAVDISMQAYNLAPTELLVVDAAKTAKAFNSLVEGYVAVENGDLAAGRTHIEASITKAEEITHPSVDSLKNTIIQLAKKVMVQIMGLEQNTQ